MSRMAGMDAVRADTKGSGIWSDDNWLLPLWPVRFCSIVVGLSMWCLSCPGRVDGNELRCWPSDALAARTKKTLENESSCQNNYEITPTLIKIAVTSYLLFGDEWCPEHMVFGAGLSWYAVDSGSGHIRLYVATVLVKFSSLFCPCGYACGNGCLIQVFIGADSFLSLPAAIFPRFSGTSDGAIFIVVNNTPLIEHFRCLIRYKKQLVW